MSLIRSTYGGRLSALQRQGARSAERMAKVQRQAVTGMRVERPSDDPGLTSRIHNLREVHRDQEVYSQNASWVDGVLNRADGALAGLATTLTQAKELAVQMSSEQFPADQRIDAAITAQSILDRALEHANAQFGDRFIFAGETYDAAAYDAAGVYQGDNGEPEVPVAEGLNAVAGFDGSQLLQGTGDMIAAFTNLVANLTTGVAANVRDSLDDIDAAVDQLTEAQAIVGGEMQTVMDAMDLATALNLEFSAELADETEVDAAQTYSDLFFYQQAYEAALGVTVQARTNLLFSRM
jgi:flagellar hook-associated protein 3 FlgL